MENDQWINQGKVKVYLDFERRAGSVRPAYEENRTIWLQ